MALLKPTTGESYNDVPDVVPPITPGVYDVECIEAEVKPNKDRTGTNLVTQWKVVNNQTENNGRRVTSYNSTSMDTAIKRIFKSAGVEPTADGGYDTDLLKGKVARVEIRPNTYVDQATGVQKESSQISNFLIPGDPGYTA